MRSWGCNPVDARIIDELRKVAGIDGVRTDDASREAAAGDKWFARTLPEAVVFGRSTASVAGVMKIAAREKIPVTTRGSGYGYVGGCVPVRGGIVLSTARITLAKLVETLEQIIGKKALIKQLPSMAADMLETWADIGKAQRVLKYEPRTRLQAGLKDFVAVLQSI